MHDVSRNDSAITITCAYENTNLVRQSKLGEHDLSRALLLLFPLVAGGTNEKKLEGRLELGKRQVRGKNLDR